MMDRNEAVLLALSAAGARDFSPAQIQKLCFLYDRRLTDELGGPHFDFQPYHYGPFDKNVYVAIAELESEGLATEARFGPAGWDRRYAATVAGIARGRELLASLPAGEDLAAALAKWVLQQSFASLVAAIYNEYPEMKANSIFSDR